MSRHQPVDSPDETTVFPYHDLTPPTTADVYRARGRVSRHLPRPPLRRARDDRGPRRGKPHDRMETFAEGIATRVPFALTTRLLRAELDDFRLVGEDDIRQAVRDLYVEERIPIEGACAASLAAMRQMSEQLQGKTVVFPVSGRNIDLDTLESIVRTA